MESQVEDVVQYDPSELDRAEIQHSVVTQPVEEKGPVIGVMTKILYQEPRGAQVAGTIFATARITEGTEGQAGKTVRATIDLPIDTFEEAKRENGVIVIPSTLVKPTKNGSTPVQIRNSVWKAFCTALHQPLRPMAKNAAAISTYFENFLGQEFKFYLGYQGESTYTKDGETKTSQARNTMGSFEPLTWEDPKKGTVNEREKLRKQLGGKLVTAPLTKEEEL